MVVCRLHPTPAFPIKGMELRPLDWASLPLGEAPYTSAGAEVTGGGVVAASGRHMRSEISTQTAPSSA